MYNPPALRIEQEFVPRPAGNSLPLYGCMIGPQYGLHRFATSGEEALLGAYDKTNGNSYSAWPDKASNSNVDVASASVWFKDAVVGYHSFSQITGSSIGLLTSGGNRIRTGGATPYVFKTANGNDRSTVYGTRDVAIGDYIKVTNGSVVVETVVMGFDADTVAATTGTVAEATGNKTSTTVGGTVTQHFGTLTGTFVASGAAYNGLAAGQPSETYTVTVLSTDGTLVGTYVKITSASGTDDVASKVLSASGVATACGTRGATFTLTQTGGTILSTDWFVVAVSMTFTAVAPAASGTYTGARSTTYIIEITNGGTVGTSTNIRYRVTSTNGYDMSPEATVAAAGAFSIGNYGVLVTFVAASKYVTGNKYTVAVTAAGSGPVRTVILGANLTGMITTDTLAITLGLTDTFQLEISQWQASASSIIVAANAVHYGTYLGTEQSFYMEKGDLYMDYRELLLDGTNTVNALSDPLDVEPTEGPAVVENPISLMLYAATTGSNGTPVYYIKTTGETLADYQDALEVLTETFQVWGLVPWNSDQTIVDLCQAHVDAMSAPDVAYFRKIYKGIDLQRYVSFYTEDSTGDELLATISGTTLTCANAEFVVANVRAGDKVKINYQPDNVGGQVYDTYEILTVGGANTLTLKTSGTLSVAVKMEIWRNQTLAEYAAAIAADARSWTDRRVSAVWCEPIKLLGQTDLPKAVMCALIAGIRSASAPHQPLTNIPLTSYIDVEPVNNFGAYQLNVMAAAGVWLVVKDVELNIFTRHQLTTDMTDVHTQEDSITSNFDHICRDFKDAVKDLNGRGNATTEMLDLLRSRIYSKKSQIQSRSYPKTLGSQITDLTITKLYIDPVLIDHVWCELDTTLPAPMNNLSLKFRLI